MRRLVVAVVLLVTGCGVRPTDPIAGSPATGALVFLVRNDAVEPVLRATRHQTDPSAALRLLAEGPSEVEQANGYRSEVPREAEPMTIEDTTVTLPIDVTTLSTVAMTQIACTAAAPGPVTLRGGGHTRGPVGCPG
ncbi:hypothetical protein [Actinophytocola xanthii]|uniref:GerMN domain-containing protein n=1 Tax=Actinophytocola xanthii TaxID=1912961 RepID=A0A1Q8CQ76_9PSEU|nr:hypothetical protein [Actinophytocola xanthii]OLF16511.1 hypothetical protein BU204_16905 [Actinophytocola xanthii]